jgi:hypothetical protein
MLIIREMGSVFPLDKTGVILNYLNPGVCITDLTRNMNPETAAPIHKLKADIGRTAEDGSRNLFHAAIAGPESHGRYLSECIISE